MVTVVLRSETIVIIILRAADAVATAITDAAVTYTGKVTDTARKAAGAVAPRVLCGILSISVLTIIVILVLIEFGFEGEKILGSELQVKQNARLARALKRLAGELYGSDVHWQLELLQNADDNSYQTGTVPTAEFLLRASEGGEVIFRCNETGFREADIRAICDIGNSSKVGVAKYGPGGRVVATGEKGLGFKAVFALTDRPRLFSGPYRLEFDSQHPSGIGYVLPRWLEDAEEARELCRPAWGSVLRMPLRPELQPRKEELFRRLASLPPSLLLFLKRLREVSVELQGMSSAGEEGADCSALRVRYAEDATVEARWEEMTGPVKLEASESFSGCDDVCTFVHWCACGRYLEMEAGVGKRTIGCSSADGFRCRRLASQLFVAERRQAPKPGSAAAEGLSKPGLASPPSTLLELALPKGPEGGFDRTRGAQQVFAFLPVRSYGLPFALQADWAVSSSREELLAGCAWNEFLKAQVPQLMLELVPAVQAEPVESALRWTYYAAIPATTASTSTFFRPVVAQVLAKLRGCDCMLTDEETFCQPQQAMRCSDEARAAFHGCSPLRAALRAQGFHLLHEKVEASAPPGLLDSLGVQRLGAAALLRLLPKTEAFPGLDSWRQILVLLDQLLDAAPRNDAPRLVEVARQLPLLPLKGDGSLQSAASKLVLPPVKPEVEGFPPELLAELRAVDPRLLAEGGADTADADEGTLDALAAARIRKLLRRLGVVPLTPRLVVKDIIGPLFSTCAVVPCLVSVDEAPRPPSALLALGGFLAQNAALAEELGPSAIGWPLKALDKVAVGRRFSAPALHSPRAAAFLEAAKGVLDIHLPAAPAKLGTTTALGEALETLGLALPGPLVTAADGDFRSPEFEQLTVAITKEARETGSLERARLLAQALNAAWQSSYLRYSRRGDGVDMPGWMYGWMDGGMDGWRDGRMDGRGKGRTEGGRETALRPRSFPAMASARASYHFVGSDDAEDMVKLPGLLPRLPLRDDTSDCTMALVFPREVDQEKIVEEPYMMLKRIFIATGNEHSTDKFLELTQRLNDEALPLAEYQTHVRRFLIEIVAESGLIMSSFPSVDEDEDFLKIYLPLDGPVIQHMAEHLEYTMPYKESVYQQVKEHGPYPGKEPMRDIQLRPLVAWDKFTVEDVGRFEDFCMRDSIRILEFWLDQWVSLDEMERQGIIKCYFPCPEADALENLHSHFLNLCKWVHFQGKQADELRKYFGEEIGFYFRFLGYVCHAMSFLGIVGFVIYASRHPAWHSDSYIPQRSMGYLRSGLALVYSVWAAILLIFWTITTARICVRWGVNDIEDYEQINPDWDPVPPSAFRPLIVNVLTGAYLAAYVGAISAVLNWQFSLQDDEDPGLGAYAPLVLTVLIKFGSLSWTWIAPAIVRLENHRREDDKAVKLSVILAVVKIFVALFPFISSCFLATLYQSTCGDTFEEAAAATFPNYASVAPLSAETMEALKPYSFEKDGRFCFHGCHPASAAATEVWAETTCDRSVSANLKTYFFFTVALDLVFLIIPIVISANEIRQERRKQERAGKDFEYSLLQWEAKKFKYEWNSWGGDKINDNLDLTISYAVVVCFGIISPIMATVCLLSLLISLRLRCYRMIYATRRPLPRASTGLGVWEYIYTGINMVAVVINVGLAAVFFYPMRVKQASEKFMIFVIGEHVVLLVQFIFRLIVPAKPADISHIEAYNMHVKKVLRTERSGMKRFEGLRTPANINLDVIPDGVQSDADSSDTANEAVLRVGDKKRSVEVSGFLLALQSSPWLPPDDSADAEDAAQGGLCCPAELVAGTAAVRAALPDAGLLKGRLCSAVSGAFAEALGVVTEPSVELVMKVLRGFVTHSPVGPDSATAIYGYLEREGADLAELRRMPSVVVAAGEAARVPADVVWEDANCDLPALQQLYSVRWRRFFVIGLGVPERPTAEQVLRRLDQLSASTAPSAALWPLLLRVAKELSNPSSADAEAWAALPAALAARRCVPLQLGGLGAPKEGVLLEEDALGAGVPEAALATLRAQAPLAAPAPRNAKDAEHWPVLAEALKLQSLSTVCSITSIHGGEERPAPVIAKAVASLLPLAQRFLIHKHRAVHDAVNATCLAAKVEKLIVREVDPPLKLRCVFSVVPGQDPIQAEVESDCYLEVRSGHVEPATSYEVRLRMLPGATLPALCVELARLLLPPAKPAKQDEATVRQTREALATFLASAALAGASGASSLCEALQIPALPSEDSADYTPPWPMPKEVAEQLELERRLLEAAQETEPERLLPKDEEPPAEPPSKRARTEGPEAVVAEAAMLEGVAKDRLAEMDLGKEHETGSAARDEADGGADPASGTALEEVSETEMKDAEALLKNISVIDQQIGENSEGKGPGKGKGKSSGKGGDKPGKGDKERSATELGRILDRLPGVSNAPEEESSEAKKEKAFRTRVYDLEDLRAQSKKMRLGPLPSRNDLPQEEREKVGRWGEQFVYEYLQKKLEHEDCAAALKRVIWVNEVEDSLSSETGFQYDLRIEDISSGDVEAYVEVKTSRAKDKQLFEMSYREWTFAQKEGSKFVIFRVSNAGKEDVELCSITNPFRQWKELNLGLCLRVNVCSAKPRRQGAQVQIEPALQDTKVSGIRWPYEK
ncbi:NOV, partial [Symbiodinium sp. KB8]